MDDRAFRDWLVTWLARHPMRRPPEAAQARYVEEVMARVSRAARPAPRPHRTLGWWIALGTAAGALLIALARPGLRPEQSAQVAQLEEELRALDEVTVASVDRAPEASDDSPEALLGADLADPSIDDAALEEWLRLFEELDRLG
jgi:hypothetical protein